MNPKGYLTVSSLIFLVVAVLHLMRIAFRVPIQIGIWPVPVWLSYVGAPVALGLSFWAFSLRESVTRVE